MEQEQIDYLRKIRKIFYDMDPKPDTYPPWTLPWRAEAFWLKEQVEFWKTHGCPADCVDWPYRVSTRGFGYVLEPQWVRRQWRTGWWCNCRRHMVQAVVWFVAHGRVKDGESPYQTCLNRKCINLAHIAIRPTALIGHDRCFYHF